MSVPCEEIRPELEALLGVMAEGQLDGPGAKRLSQILKEHPDARQFYFDYCQMHALLQSAHGPLPNVAEMIAGEPIRGSWWNHPASRSIFAALNPPAESPDVVRPDFRSS